MIRGLLALPKSCPTPSLAYESISLQMKYRMFGKILNFTKHILYQDEESSLAKQVLNEQILNEWSGLYLDSKRICEELDISGLFNPTINKKQFKVIVRNACKKKNEEDLIRQISTYKKMSALRDELTKGNKYFYTETLKNARTIFRFRVEMFEAKINFKQKSEYKKEKYLCDSCESEIDENTHVLFCPSYSDLREEKNLQNDAHVAEYLQKVLEIRTKLRLNR